MSLGDYMPRKWRERRTEDRPMRATGAPMARVGQMLDRFISDFFEMSPLTQIEHLGAFSPRVNLSENENSITITAELPGMDEKDVDVTLTRDRLILRGEKKEEHSDGERGRYYECSYGTFERHIPLPVDVNEDEVTAHFDRGVLTITLPKTEEARSRTKKVVIQKGSERRTGEEKRTQPRQESAQTGRDESRTAH